MTELFHPFIDLPVIVVLTTATLWVWARWKSRFVLLSQEREQIRRQNRSATITFGGLLLLECLTFVVPEMLVHAFFPLSATLIFLRFAAVNGPVRQGFWARKRNLFLAAAILTGVSFATPLVLTEPITVPLLYSLWVTQICLANIAGIFRDNVRDLEVLQSKLLSLAGEQHRERLVREAALLEAPASASGLRAHG